MRAANLALDRPDISETLKMLPQSMRPVQGRPRWTVEEAGLMLGGTKTNGHRLLKTECARRTVRSFG